jgi:transcriptional regulator with XRE-family HTH domain
MAIYVSGRPKAVAVDCAQTDATRLLPGLHSVSVPAQDTWSRQEFTEWLDSIKARQQLPSDNQLAQFFGISHSMISAWRSGRQRPSLDTLTSLAITLQIDARPLWVLAGLADAADIGLAEDAADDLVRDAARPAEVDEFMRVYNDPRMTDEDRADMRRQLRRLARGVVLDLEDRDRPAEQAGAGRRRRVG